MRGFGFAALLLLVGCQEPGVKVNVKNGHESAVSDVTLHWEGERVSVGVLAPGETRSATIRPRAESPLVVKYRDARGAAAEWSPGNRQHKAGPPIDVVLGAPPEAY